MHLGWLWMRRGFENLYRIVRLAGVSNFELSSIMAAVFVV